MTVHVVKTGAGCRRPGLVQDWGSFGILFAVEPGVSDFRFDAGLGEASWVSRIENITGLDVTDGRILADWLNCAGTGGIDSIVDLALRPWKIDGPCAIIGVFEKAKDHASWIIMRSRAGWVLIDCGDGFVSDESAALPDILALIDASDTNRRSHRLV